MNRIIKTAAIAAIAAAGVIGTTGATTNAEAPSGSTCTPSAARPEVHHTVYEWKALVAKGGLHWEYKLTDSAKNPSSDIFHIWVKSLDLTTRGWPQITKTVIDTPAKAAVPCDSDFYEVRFSDPSGKHINLPDVFDIEHAGEFAEGTYWATKVQLTIVNDTNTDQEFRIRYVDQQDGNRVWVQGTRFADGLPNNVVAANSSRPFEIEVWHNVVSGADVPDDLTLDFGFELA